MEITITLETNAGAFVTLTRIPELESLPQIIIWGGRYFISCDKARTYREATTYTVPPQYIPQ